MALRWLDWPLQALAALRKGAVIPAHPLALDSDRKLDPRRQRALTRYRRDYSWNASARDSTLKASGAPFRSRMEPRRAGRSILVVR